MTTDRIFNMFSIIYKTALFSGIYVYDTLIKQLLKAHHTAIATVICYLMLHEKVQKIKRLHKITIRVQKVLFDHGHVT